MQFFWKVNNLWWQKKKNSHRVYPPEIIQTSSLGRLQKNHWSAILLLFCSVHIITESQEMSSGNVPSR